MRPRASAAARHLDAPIVAVALALCDALGELWASMRRFVDLVLASVTSKFPRTDMSRFPLAADTSSLPPRRTFRARLIVNVQP